MAQLLIDHDADVNLKSNVQAILFTVLLVCRLAGLALRMNEIAARPLWDVCHIMH